MRLSFLTSSKALLHFRLLYKTMFLTFHFSSLIKEQSSTSYAAFRNNTKYFCLNSSAYWLCCITGKWPNFRV